MSQTLNQLQPAMRAFFEAFLDHDGRPSLHELREQQGPELEISVGLHRPYQGSPSHFGGIPFLPRYAIHVEPKLIGFRGQGRRVTFFQEQPMASRSQEDAAGPNATPVITATRARPFEYSLLRVVERVDPLHDSQADMERILADLRPPSTWNTDPAPGTSSQPSGMAQTWAAAVIQQREQDADAFRIPLGQLEAVPEHMPTRNLGEYRQIMLRYFTYTTDGVGHYYPKANQSMPGEGGLPTGFPEGTTEQYRRLNVEEIELEPGKYCLALVPDGWAEGVDRQVGRFREIVFEIRPVQDGGFTLHPVHWAARTVRWGDAPARDSYDFCFFIVDTTPEQRDEEDVEPWEDDEFPE